MGWVDFPPARVQVTNKIKSDTITCFTYENVPGKSSFVLVTLSVVMRLWTTAGLRRDERKLVHDGLDTSCDGAVATEDRPSVRATTDAPATDTMTSTTDGFHIVNLRLKEIKIKRSFEALSIDQSDQELWTTTLAQIQGS
jgi:hypothetical protein